TPAARMPQVPGDAGKARARRLRAIGRERLGRLLPSFEGRRVNALMETETLGRTPEYLAVEMEWPQVPGALVAVDVTGVRGETLTGQAA
ncbi:MAG: tRNA (N(6)-L-threonylcarbamoyladenosine(37)-C(2))-methylthiotransferase MtaB, partial [Hyphomicrobiales bacterium]